MPDITLILIDIAPFIAIGMAAQMIDGALGMAFGVITQTLLVSALGVPPATASASVHLVELFTTGASGASHIWHRNVDWGLFWRLVPFGVLGGVSGAYLLSSIDASAARPFVMIYLTGIGFYLLWRAVRMSKPRFEDPRYTRPLALAGPLWLLGSADPVRAGPSVRETAAEALYALPLGPGQLQFSLFHRTHPGHIAASPDDDGAAVRFHWRW